MSESSVLVIALHGELDINRTLEIDDALKIEGPGAPVLLDFSDVTYADSTVISALYRFMDAGAKVERRAAILIVSPQLARLLEYAGVGEAFPLFSDRGAALTYLMGQ